MRPRPWTGLLAFEVRRAAREAWATSAERRALRRRLSTLGVEVRAREASVRGLERALERVVSPAPAVPRNALGQFICGANGLGGRYQPDNPGRFRPGHRPANAVPVGTERVRRSANGPLLLVIKVRGAHPHLQGRTTHWQRKARVVWERMHRRRVPPGHHVIQVNGDPLDCTPQNLALVSGAVAGALARSGFWRLPLALRPVELARIRVLVTARRRRREEFVDA